MSRGRLGASGVALSLALLLIFVSGAYARGIAVHGATYTGVASGGVQVTFTVSSDGTIVDSYWIAGAVGYEPNGHTCDFVAGGASGVWQGAPVDGNAFKYNLGSAIVLQGRFTGARTAAGSFRLYDVARGSSPACDTGTVAWTATTTADPRGKTPTLTRVSLQKRSARWLSGSLKSATRACAKARTVYLVLGTRRVMTVRTNARGAYRLRITAELSNQHVRAVVLSRRTRRALCAASSSQFLTA